ISPVRTGATSPGKIHRGQIMKLFWAAIRTVAFGLGLLLIVGIGGSSARADEVTLTGSTTFINSAPFVTFTTNTFTGTTALGIGSLSGANSLGTFALATGATQLTGGGFQMDITFTSPTGITGGQGATYTATIVGSVSPNIDQGGVNIHFTSPIQNFTFSNAGGTGTFSLTVADLFVETGRSAQITAGITGNQSPIPEPTTLLLLGTGLTGVATKLRQRSRARKENR